VVNFASSLIFSTCVVTHMATGSTRGTSIFPYSRCCHRGWYGVSWQPRGVSGSFFFLLVSLIYAVVRSVISCSTFHRRFLRCCVYSGVSSCSKSKQPRAFYAISRLQRIVLQSCFIKTKQDKGCLCQQKVKSCILILRVYVACLCSISPTNSSTPSPSNAPPR
jgi:hypothetical protein